MKLKPQKMDVIKNYDTGRSIDLMLDRDTKEFFFEDRGVRVVQKNFDDLKKLASKAVRDTSDLEWTPWIFIEYEHGPSKWFQNKKDAQRTEELKLTIDRFEVAKLSDGTFRRRAHTLDLVGVQVEWRAKNPLDNSSTCDEPRVSGERNADDDEDGSSIHRIFVPYTEETWTAVTMLHANIRDLGSKIATFMTPKIIASLGTYAPLQITEGSKAKAP